MALRNMDASGSGTTANPAAGIDYAAANGASIIITSFGFNLQSDFFNFITYYGISKPGVAMTTLYNSYELSDGTSMAAPFVAGIAVMVKSRNPKPQVWF